MAKFYAKKSGFSTDKRKNRKKVEAEKPVTDMNFDREKFAYSYVNFKKIMLKSNMFR